MTPITLDSIDPQLAHRLHQRALKNGRTIEAEITTILSSVLTSETAEQTAADDDKIGLATVIKQRFAPLGGFDLPEIPREPIRTPPLF